MTCFIILILSALLLLSLWKWLKWKVSALLLDMFITEKYRKPTKEEIEYYARIIARKILHIK